MSEDNACGSNQESAMTGGAGETNATKHLSEAIIERNRRNARLSTGPTSPEGKQRSRWNALKHGLLVREVIIPAGQGEENRDHFTAVVKQFREGLDIQGVGEELLVERLAVVYWKMRRVEIGEVGELRLLLDTIKDRIFTAWMDNLGDPDPDLKMPLKRYWRHTVRDLSLLEELENIVREQGRLPVEVFAKIAKECSSLAIKEMLVDYRDDADGIQLKAERRGGLLARIRSLRKYVGRSAEVANASSVNELAMRIDAEAAASHLPQLPRANFIQRRESSYDLQFHRALREIERLQSKRGGGAHRWAAIAQDDHPQGADQIGEAWE